MMAHWPGKPNAQVTTFENWPPAIVPRTASITLCRTASRSRAGIWMLQNSSGDMTEARIAEAMLRQESSVSGSLVDWRHKRPASALTGAGMIERNDRGAEDERQGPYRGKARELA